MADIKQLFALIEQCRQEHNDQVVIAGPPPEQRILAAESALGVPFPRSYRQFLARYGYTAIGSEEFCGLPSLGDHGFPSVVWETLNQRQVEGLLHPLVVVQVEYDGRRYCIDTSQTGPNGEAPVVVWMPGRPRNQQSLRRISPGFADFAIARLEELLADDEWWKEAESDNGLDRNAIDA